MTELWIWGLIASLILLAIGASLKSAHDAFLLKQSDKEVTRLLSEIEALKKLHNETISGVLKSHAAETEKLTNRIQHLESLSKKQSLHQPMPTAPSGPQSWMAR